MKPLLEILKMYPSDYAAARHMGVHAAQLTRWKKVGALVDVDGNVWTKTGKNKLKIWPASTERMDIIGSNGNDGDHYND